MRLKTLETGTLRKATQKVTRNIKSEVPIVEEDTLEDKDICLIKGYKLKRQDHLWGTVM